MHTQLVAHLRLKQDHGLIQRIHGVKDIVRHSMNQFLLWHRSSNSVYISTTHSPFNFWRRFHDAAVANPGQYDKTQGPLRFFVTTTHYGDWEVYQGTNSGTKTFPAVYYESFDGLRVVCQARKASDHHRVTAEAAALYEVYHTVSGLTRWYYGPVRLEDKQAIEATKVAIGRCSPNKDGAAMKINPRFKLMRSLWLRGIHSEFCVFRHDLTAIVRSGMGAIMFIQHQNQLEVDQERIDRRVNAINTLELGAVLKTASRAPVPAPSSDGDPPFPHQELALNISSKPQQFTSVWDAICNTQQESNKMKNLSEAFYWFTEQVQEKNLADRLTPEDQLALERGQISRFSFERLIQVTKDLGLDVTVVQELADKTAIPV